MHEVGLAPRFLHIDGAWRDHRIYAVTVEECPGGMLARLDGLTAAVAAVAPASALGSSASLGVRGAWHRGTQPSGFPGRPGSHGPLTPGQITPVTRVILRHTRDAAGRTSAANLRSAPWTSLR